jgi:hypothetical protein
MSDWENVQLKGLNLFTYLIEHYNMSPEKALTKMKEHNQDVKDAELFVKLLNKQEGK